MSMQYPRVHKGLVKAKGVIPVMCHYNFKEASRIIFYYACAVEEFFYYACAAIEKDYR